MTTSNWWIYPNIAPLMTDFLMRLPSKWRRVTENISGEEQSILGGIFGSNTTMFAFRLTISPPPGCSGFLDPPSLFYPLVTFYVVSP